MHLQDIIHLYSQSADTSLPDADSSNSHVPEWMMGCFKRRSIAFANGLSDTKTHVFWLQSRNLTIDLRLPLSSEQVSRKALADCTHADLLTLTNYEGWSADSTWQDGQLSWSGGTSFQTHNRWPEPAELKRIGDCMIEFAPSGAYVEDWRLCSRNPGPLVGLRLIDEIEQKTGSVRHRDGALIINGDWAGLVRGRPTELEKKLQLDLSNEMQLRDLVADIKASNNTSEALAQLEKVFNFETSVAQGCLSTGFTITDSTKANRLGAPLFELEGFEWDKEQNQLVQRFEEHGKTIIRRFEIDSLEASFNYSPITAQSANAKEWFEKESETLSRYLIEIS